jgi:glutathione S-transferase
MLAPPELRAIHPLGKSPVIDRTASTAETGAIIEQILPRPTARALTPPAGQRGARA